MRLHQPTGIWLLMWPCWWSVTLASFALPRPEILALFAVGAVIMRGAGCIINDIADRKIDAQVKRTRLRPIASGEISVKQAAGLLIALLFIALAIALALGEKVVVWAALSLVFVATYPWMKRITWWPQFFLGLTFNWGVLLGWVAVTGSIDIPALWLYAGGVFWTLGYDTIYAHQDKNDDRRIGVKSTALLLGGNTKRALKIFYALAMACWVIAGYMAGSGILFFSLLAFAWMHLHWQVSSVDLDAPNSCRKVFISNTSFGWLLFLACLAGKI